MSKCWTWEKAAKICQEKYGVFVSFDEGDEKSKREKVPELK